jgi:hypothetical protein
MLHARLKGSDAGAGGRFLKKSKQVTENREGKVHWRRPEGGL